MPDIPSNALWITAAQMGGVVALSFGGAVVGALLIARSSLQAPTPDSVTGMAANVGSATPRRRRRQVIRPRVPAGPSTELVHPEVTEDVPATKSAEPIDDGFDLE